MSSTTNQTPKTPALKTRTIIIIPNNGRPFLAKVTTRQITRWWESRGRIQNECGPLYNVERWILAKDWFAATGPQSAKVKKLGQAWEAGTAKIEMDGTK